MTWMSGISAPSEWQQRAEYAEIGAMLGDGAPLGVWRDALRRWEIARRGWRDWANLTRLRFSQDTRRDDYRTAQTELDRRSPTTTSLDASLKRRFLASPVRAQIEAHLGRQAFALWEADVSAFSEAIAGDLVRESELVREYTELVASVRVTFAGQERTLASLGPFLTDASRETRHAAECARWGAFDACRERLDSLFDELVRLRDGMARALGYRSFVELGYRRMRRIGYGPNEVGRYRDAVHEVVVPLAHELVRRYGAGLNVERVFFWDEAGLGVGTDATPRSDVASIARKAGDALGALDPSLDEFVRVVLELDLLDVEARPGKALGAYCTNFPTRGLPFVFANFSGTRFDVKTLMHELGHAFQSWRSRDKAFDYLVPTLETAEIHSMSLEYLAWPEMERFFGNGADAYRREHLIDAILFLPYGVAIDHFQHLVYANSGASPLERHAMWQEVERRYLPWRDYGDLAHPAAGGLWQEKRHVYVQPFYYIDYTLALCCALQFWNRARSDRTQAMADYVALCGRGGQASFGELVRSANLRSPFEPGTLQAAVAAAHAVL
jgi:M3 family oligoendopeptidase